MVEPTQSASFNVEQDSTDLEPGLLAVFRLMMGLYAGFAVIGMVGEFFFDATRPHAGSIWLVVGLSLLLVYLWRDEWRTRLGRYYLPIGLAIATLLPLAERTLTIRLWLLDPTLVEFERLIVATGWQLVLALFVPLILIAWQYRWRDVVLYAFVTMVAEIIFASMIWHPSPREAAPVIAMTMGRLFLYLIVGFVITRMVSAQRTQRQKLADANARLVAYAATAEQLAVSHERNRLARELHDTLAHTLSSLSVQLEAVDSVWDPAPDQARSLLRKARSNARSGLTETRRALKALRASPLEDLGLTLAIRNLVEATAARSGLAVQVDIGDDIDRLPLEIEQSVYRTVQEALANVVKHSGARHVAILLYRHNREVVLRISDDGQGFAADSRWAQDGAEDDHYGLRGLDERANMVGGKLLIESEIGAGTLIQLTVPVT